MIYVRIPLSLRNFGDLLHERGIDVTHESVRYCWHHDEIFVKNNGQRHYLWRAVDHEGKVLEGYVTTTRVRKTASKFLRKTMRKHGRHEDNVTDRLRSYGAALKEIGAEDRQETRC